MKEWLAQIKEYWFLIVFIFGGVWGIVELAGDNYVGGVADDTLKSDASKQYLRTLIKEEMVASAEFTEVNGKLVLHESQIAGNSKTIEMTQSQLQDVAKILMQPPE